MILASVYLFRFLLILLLGAGSRIYMLVLVVSLELVYLLIYSITYIYYLYCNIKQRPFVSHVILPSPRFSVIFYQKTRDFSRVYPTI